MIINPLYESLFGIYPILNIDPQTDIDRLLDWSINLYDAGIRITQIRAKMFSDDVLPGLLDELVSNLKGSGLTVILNDYVELVGMTGADGVHLGLDDYPVKEAGKILGSSAIIGSTCRTEEQAMMAVRNKASYVAVGSVFESPTKPGIDLIGVEGLKAIVEVVGPEVPVCAIGGITRENIREIKSAGARMAAVIGAIQDSADPLESAKELVSAWMS